MQERKILVIAGGIVAIALLALIAQLFVRLLAPVAIILPDGSLITGRTYQFEKLSFIDPNRFEATSLDDIQPSGERGIYYLKHPAPVTYCGPDGFPRMTLTTAATVREFLNQAGVEVGDLDIITPPPDQPVPECGVIRLSHISESFETAVEPVPFRSVLHVDPNLKRGQERIISRGVDGSREVTYRITKENGFPLNREPVSEKIIKEPVPQKSLVGVRPEGVSNRQLEARQVRWMHATAYDPGVGSNGPFAGRPTAYGLKAGRGVVAVDPRVIKLGTRLYIEGYGYAIAGDTGGAIKGNRIDLCYDTRDEAIRFGRRDVKVYILD